MESPTPTAVEPVASGERILDLDILRGLALFGILLANMRGFSAPIEVYFDIGRWFPGRSDRMVQFAVEVLVQRKFVALFSFMFGIGFAVQMARAESRGARFLAFYPRRLTALALFGLLHGILIWAGDILLTYAIAGALLLRLRHASQKALLRWAGGIFLGATLVTTVFAVAAALGMRRSAPGDDFDPAKVARAVHIYAYGSLPEMLRQNWIEWLQEAPGQLFSVFALALFCLGLWVYRAGILENLGRYRPALKRICAWCLPLGIALNLLFAVLQVRYPRAPRPPLAMWTIGVLQIWAAPILSAGYAAGLAVLLQRPWWRRVLHPFAAVGRTALTNYLAQSVICVAFFRLTHLHGVWGPAWDLLPTAVLFSLQVFFGNWWLHRYRFGPVEWVWRGLTYGKLPPLRNAN